jgi:hypothetical protein
MCYKEKQTVSYCWQAIMARTKTRFSNGYTRVHTVRGTTVTTHWIPTNVQPLTTKLKTLEKDILRNIGIIQQFNLSFATGPATIEDALSQRQRYHTIRENCVLTLRKVNRALYLSDEEASPSQQAYHAIFTTLKTLLKNESDRTEEINMKAIRYWIDYTVPEPPTEPPPSVRIPSESFIRRIGLHSDVSTDTTSDTNEATSPMYSPTSDL